MGDAAAEAQIDMQATTADTGKDLDEAVRKCEERWKADLEDGTRQIRDQVDKGLAQHDKTLADLEAKIDEKAAETQGSGFWSTLGAGVLNVLKFVGGVIVGILEAAWELIGGLWNLLVALVKALASGSFIVWFLLIVVVALLVLIFIFAGGWVGVGIFLGALLLAAGIVFAVLGVIKAFGYLKDAFTKPGLSWYERGKLVGKAIFEFAMAALIVAEWLRPASLARAARPARQRRRECWRSCRRRSAMPMPSNSSKISAKRVPRASSRSWGPRRRRTGSRASRPPSSASSCRSSAMPRSGPSSPNTAPRP
jgi:hypothetical protein